MSLVSNLKNAIPKYNPLARLRRRKMRKRLQNTTATFLCPNCIGGILYHDLGLKFRSPTVNLMMTQTDFVRFVTNLNHYLSCELQPIECPGFTCPCMLLDDIIVHFTHYASYEEAAAKWNERKARINFDNLFIFLTERDNVTKEQIQSLSAVGAKGIVVFTANSYPDIPYAVHIPKYEKDGEVGNILKKSYLNDQREYEKYFDFVGWFNNADYSDLSVARFRR